MWLSHFSVRKKKTRVTLVSRPAVFSKYHHRCRWKPYKVSIMSQLASLTSKLKIENLKEATLSEAAKHNSPSEKLKSEERLIQQQQVCEVVVPISPRNFQPILSPRAAAAAGNNSCATALYLPKSMSPNGSANTTPRGHFVNLTPRGSHRSNSTSAPSSRPVSPTNIVTPQQQMNLLNDNNSSAPSNAPNSSGSPMRAVSSGLPDKEAPNDNDDDDDLEDDDDFEFVTPTVVINEDEELQKNFDTQQ